MMKSIVETIDSLFWKTTITTTITIVRHPCKRIHSDPHGFRVMMNDFSPPPKNI